MTPTLSESFRENYSKISKEKGRAPPRRVLFMELLKAMDFDLEEVDTLQDNPMDSGDFRIRTSDLYNMYMRFCEVAGVQPAYIKTKSAGYMSQEKLQKHREESGKDIEVETV